MDIDQSLNLKRSSILDTMMLYIATGMFVLLIILASLQVVIRLLPIDTSLRWTEALARFVLIIGTYFGAAVATRNREHIRINLLLDWLEGRNPHMNRALKVCIGGVVVLFTGIAAYSVAIAVPGNIDSTLPGTAFVTSGMIYAAVGLGLTIMCIYEIINVKEDVREFAGHRSRSRSGVEE